MTPPALPDARAAVRRPAASLASAGSCLPAAPQAPGAGLVYVDNDAVAVQHSRAILARNGNAIAIQADLRRPREILGRPQLLDLLDLSQPVALLLVAVLHFFPDSDAPAALVAGLREALAPGSYVVISHGTTDGQAPGVAEAMGHYNQTTAPFQPRRQPAIRAFFGDLELVDPGLVLVARWWPDREAARDGPGQIAAYGGVGYTP